MPDCSENYETEISDGRNARNVKCQECGCLILKPSIASFTNLEVRLSYIFTDSFIKQICFLV